MKLNTFSKYAGVIAMVALVGDASAVVDTTAIQAELDAMPGYMVIVGSALITAAATAIGFKWIKGAIFS